MKNELKDAFLLVNADLEDELEHYCVYTESIQKAMDHNSLSCILLGEKGSGKTAAFQALTKFENTNKNINDRRKERPNTIRAIKYTEESNSLDDLTLRSTVFKEEFKYAIAIDIIKCIVEESLRDTKLKKSLVGPIEEAEKYISLYNSWLRSIKKFINKSKDIRIKNIKISSKSPLNICMNLIPPEADFLHEFVKKNPQDNKVIELLGKLTDKADVRMVIDDPEEVFFKKTKNNYELLAGLWHAAYELNLICKKLKIVILMKTDVFRKTFESYDDADKLPNSFEYIYWNDEFFKELIKKRVEHFCGNTSGVWWQELFGSSFSEIQLNDIIKYISQNLRNGPRDLIRILSISISDCNNEYLDKTNIENAIDVYSSESIENVLKIHKKTFPNILDVLKFLFGDFVEEDFSIDQLKNHIEKKMGLRYKKELDHLSWKTQVSKVTFPQILHDLGLLAITSKDNQYFLPYNKNYSILKLTDIDICTILPLYKKCISSS